MMPGVRTRRMRKSTRVVLAATAFCSRNTWGVMATTIAQASGARRLLCALADDQRAVTQKMTSSISSGTHCERAKSDKSYSSAVTSLRSRRRDSQAHQDFPRQANEGEQQLNHGGDGG
jgi:hypothetical protein